jgi:hypothetical protein
MILYIAAMCGFAYLIIATRSAMLVQQQQYAFNSTYSTGPGYGYQTVAGIGRDLYSTVIFIQSLLVLVVAPAITAAMVKNEKERQTFEFLKVTTISPVSYVFGALVSTFLYVAVALICSLPVVSIAYLYGGVSNVVQNILALLGFSLILSSAGMMVSCMQEPRRTGQGIVVFAVVLVVLFVTGGGMLFRLAAAATGQKGTLTFFGAAIPYWVTIWAVSCAIGALFLLVAARKIFTPNERAFSYRQFAYLYLGVLGLAVTLLAYVAATNPVPSALTGGVPASAGVVTVLLIVFTLASVVMQITMLLSRVEVGNERWRVQKDHASLRGKPENSWYVFILTAIGFVVVGATTTLLVPGVGLGYLLPLVAFLLLHAAFCGLLIQRVENEARCVKAVVAVDAILLFALPLFNSAQPAGSFRLAGLLGRFLSPLDLAMSALPWSQSYGPVIPGTAGMLIAAALLAFAARCVRPIEPPEPVRFDMEA